MTAADFKGCLKKVASPRTTAKDHKSRESYSKDTKHSTYEQPHLANASMSPYTSGQATMATQEFTTVGMVDDVDIEIQAMEADMLSVGNRDDFVEKKVIIILFRDSSKVIQR